MDSIVMTYLIIGHVLCIMTMFDEDTWDKWSSNGLVHFFISWVVGTALWPVWVVIYIKILRGDYD